MLCQWHDGLTNWVALKDMKQSYLLKVAEFAFANCIHETEFAWWVYEVMRKHERILKELKTKYWQRTHKFGIRLPKTMVEALQLDKENGNKYWWDAICLEMKNVRPAFKKWEKCKNDPPLGYQKIKCHFIFDIKMGENFRHKARLVANGNMMEPPAALNELQLLACDIQNAYLMADC